MGLPCKNRVLNWLSFAKKKNRKKSSVCPPGGIPLTNPQPIFRRKIFFSTLTPKMTPFQAEIGNFEPSMLKSIFKELFKSVEIFRKFHREGGQNQVQSFFLKILLSLVIIKISNFLPPSEQKRKKLKSRNLAFLHDLLQPRFVQNFGSLCYAVFEILRGPFSQNFQFFYPKLRGKIRDFPDF